MKSLKFRLIMAVLFVLLLTILPLPDLVISLKPAWILLLVLYLQCFLPEYFNISLLITLGFILDVLLSTVMGEHALALSLILWISNEKSRRFSFFSLGQQMMLIGFLCLLYQLLILTIDAFLGYHVRFFMPLGSALTTMLFWPWVKRLADDVFFVRDVVCR